MTYDFDAIQDNDRRKMKMLQLFFRPRSFLTIVCHLNCTAYSLFSVPIG